MADSSPGDASHGQTGHGHPGHGYPSHGQTGHGHPSHGHTAAAWTAVLIIVAGFVVAGIGVMMLSWQVFWFGGVGLMVLGAITGKVMQMMGLGQAQPGRTESPDEAGERVSAGAEGRDG